MNNDFDSPTGWRDVVIPVLLILVIVALAVRMHSIVSAGVGQ